MHSQTRKGYEHKGKERVDYDSAIVFAPARSVEAY